MWQIKSARSRLNKSWLLWGACFLLGLLSLLASRSGHLQALDQVVGRIVAPIYSFVDHPFSWWDEHWHTVQRGRVLTRENAKLRVQLMLLRGQLQKVRSLESENKQLMALLRSSATVNDKVLVASIMSISLNPFQQQIVLDKGLEDHVYIGQPIVDAHGVLGQVSKVMAHYSVVTPMTHERHAIPVETEQGHIHGVVVGSGLDKPLQLLHATAKQPIHTGEVLLTTGLGGRFPSGYPVGRVVDVGPGPNGGYQAISVEPSADLNRSRQVLLIWHEQASKVSLGSRSAKGGA